MRDQLTQSDIDKMQQEIEYRKLVKRPELLEAARVIRSQVYIKHSLINMEKIKSLMKTQSSFCLILMENTLERML